MTHTLHQEPAHDTATVGVDAPLPPRPSSGPDTWLLALGALVVSVLALVVAMVVAMFTDETEAPSGPQPVALTLSLTEFALSPAALSVPPQGAVLTITNNGTMMHNLVIPELQLVSDQLNPGDSDTLRIPGSTTGMFEMLCTIPGHVASGMSGMVHVGDSSAPPNSTAPTMSADEMDRVMEEVALAFPAKTEGHGGELLQPTVEPDGTKAYELTASIVDWEVEPGKRVKAWTYNGVVPGPEIRLSVGDRVAITLHNELPESTALHFHGVRLPNEFDGVPPYTQDPIKPGESFTYRFTVIEEAVGMYHSHHDAQIQVPNGLAGAFLVGEPKIPESLRSQGYTSIDHRVNMVLNDAGTIGLSLNGKSFPATEAYSMKVGETMLVNYFNEGLMSHPMHMHQPKGFIIAKDGVPLESPMPGDTINIAPGERYTVLYEAMDPGVWAWHCHILNHAEGPRGMFGMVTAVIIEE